MSNLSPSHLHDEEAAYAYLEAALWPNGPICPHCGGTERIVRIPANPTARVRYGLYRCNDCTRQFTVKVGTVFEASKVPLTKWLQAVVLMVSSKKGISSHQLHRTLGVTYKTAWFMSHRIREAMRDGSLAPLGGNGATVEADETFIGRKEGVPMPKAGYSHKHAVMALVERGGKARSVHLSKLTKAETSKILHENVARESRLMTDEGRHYRGVGKDFAGHGTIHHTLGEYVNPADASIHTNTVEGYFSIFKRGMKGVYQPCKGKHLHRYLAEFDFRYNHRVALGIGDGDRAVKALEGVKGKRLTYRRVDQSQ